MVLLDTNICIYLINEESEYHQSALKRLLCYKKESVFVSIITLCELYYGVENSRLKERNLRLLNDFISNFEILTLDSIQARIYAKIRSELNAKNRKIGDFMNFGKRS